MRRAKARKLKDGDESSSDDDDLDPVDDPEIGAEPEATETSSGVDEIKPRSVPNFPLKN